MKKSTLMAAALAVAALGVLGQRYWQSLYHGPREVPALTVTATDGSRINLQELRGRPVLVNFWAPSCSDCMKEMPDLKALQSEFGPKGFTIVAIAVPWDPPPAVMHVIEDRQLNFPVAIDLTNEAQRAFGGVEWTPTSFLIAPDGRVTQRITDTIDAEALRRQLRDWLGS